MPSALNLIMAAADRLVHRCGGCGGWVYHLRPCFTCRLAANRKARR